LKVHGILLAAGKSIRFKENKLFSIVNDFPIIKYPIETFTNSSLIDTLTITTDTKNKKKIEDIFSDRISEKITFIEGGSSRNESEFNALKYLELQSVQENDLIVIHDAARAFLSTDLLNRLILHAQEFGSASPYISSGLLINDGNEIIEKGIVEIQTPQIFDFKNLMKSYKEAALDGFNSVDTTECISKYTKIIPQVIEGETLNKKITYKQDLDELKEILEV